MAQPRGVTPATAEAVRSACLCLHAQRAGRVLARRFDTALRSVSLTNEQFSLLMAIAGADGPSIRDLAQVVWADRTTVTAALRPLVRDGLVEVRADPRDARVRRVRLTGEGVGRLARALPLWRRTHDALERGLGQAEAAGLRRALNAVAMGAGRGGAQTPGRAHAPGQGGR